jgi:hypothetical protein
MFPQTIGRGKRRDRGATAEWLRSTGKRIDADTALLLAGFWAINALLFDYRSNYRLGRSPESRAIIEKWGDYRPVGGSVPDSKRMSSAYGAVPSEDPAAAGSG